MKEEEEVLVVFKLFGEGNYDKEWYFLVDFDFCVYVYEVIKLIFFIINIKE